MKRQAPGMPVEHAVVAMEGAGPLPYQHGVEPFIDKEELGRRLGLRPRTVDDWMKRGVLPFYKIRRVVRFKWSEVEKELARTCRVGGDGSGDGTNGANGTKGTEGRRTV